MDLTLTDKHRALQAEVQAFIRAHGQNSPKPGGGRKRPDQQDAGLAETAGRARLRRAAPCRATTAASAPTPDVLDLAVIAEAFSRANLYQGLTNQGISMLVPTLLEVGTEEQRRAVDRARPSAAT